MSSVPGIVGDIVERVDDPQVKRFVQYLTVGLVGIGINEGVLFLVTGVAGLSYVLGGALGRVVSIAANYAINDSWTWGERGSPGTRGWLWRGVKYGATRVVGVGIGLAALVVFVEYLSLHYLVANLLAIGVGVLWGFGASDRWVWPAEGRGSVVDALPSRLRTRLGGIDRSTWLVVGFAGVLFVAFSAYTVALYRGYQLTGADFGSYVHMFATTLNGEGFLLQGKYRAGHPSGVYWGAHFSLTLLAFLPVYALVPRPETLLVAKSFVLAASVVLLWFLARTHLRSDRLAGLVVVSYGLNPFLWSAWAFDFQEQVLLPVFVFLAYYWYRRERWVGFLVALALALLTNEFVVVIVAGVLFGWLFETAREGRLRERAPLIASAFAVTVAVRALSGAVIDRFSESSGIPTRVVAVPLQPYIDGSRVSVAGLLDVVAARPELLVQSLLDGFPRKALVLAAFLLPVGFLVTDGIAAGALVPFVGFAWFLASKGSYANFAAHYPLYVAPFLYVGVVRVLDRLSLGDLFDDAPPDAELPSDESETPLDVDVPAPTSGLAGTVDRLGGRLTAPDGRGLYVRALVTLLLVNATAGLMIEGGNMQPVRPVGEDTETLEAAIEVVPREASLLTQNDVYPHVATRPDAHFVVSPYEFERYESEHGPIAPEYVLYDTELNGVWAGVVLDSVGDRLGEEYGLYRQEDGVWLFRRGYDGPARSLTDGEPIAWVGSDLPRAYDATRFEVGDGRRVAGDVVSEGGRPGGAIWYGPYLTVAPGTYEATFQVRATGPEESVARVDVAAGRNHRVRARAPVRPSDGWQWVTLRFELDRPTTRVEFRGFRTGEGTVRLAGVTLERVGTPGESADE